MIRRGFKEWVHAGMSRDETTGRIADPYLDRGRDPYQKVTWEEAYRYSAEAIKNFAET